MTVPNLIDQAVLKYMFDSGLWIFMLESVVALGVLAFIVWWTLPRRKRPPEPGKDSEL